MTKFAHLHQHTSYSLLDGLSNVKDLLKWVSEGATDPSCAITDHGNMSGVLQFYKYAIQFGVKPILGYEAYITAGSRHTKQKGEKTYHLTLLAKDFEGYQNLCRLNYLANSEGYYYKPRIDHEILEQHSKGVIAMSGCLGAELQQHILSGDLDSARSTIEWYLKVFKDNYYIEIQNHGLPEQQLVNPILMQLAKEYGIGMVATNDGHYVKKTDSDTHDTLLAIQTKARLSDDNRFKFPCDEFYTKSVGEMELFLPRSVWGDEIYDNTVNISQACNVVLPIGSKRTYRIPQPKLQEGDTSDAKIYRLVNKGLRKRYGANLTADKIKRAEYELSVIKKMGFTDYFLIVQDYVNWAKKQGIAVGLGRGSGAGSLIGYAIGITDVDPIKYGLIFERFLNPDRVSMADYDIDISDTGRERVIAYVRDKYGEDHVCMIGTYGAMLSRSCLKDVARAMGISHDTVNILTGMIPVKFGKPSTLMEAYESSQQIRDFLDMHEDVKRAYYYALNLEGTIRSSGVHASGLIISDTSLTDLIPLTVDRATGKSVSQYDMHDVEDIGLVKMDFLGLRTLTFLEKAKDLLLQHKGIPVVFNDVPLDDPKVYKLLSRGDNKGIFQLEGSGISQASKSLKPERFEDIVALTSLYRPGPMDNIGTYIKRRHGLEEISYKDFPQSGHLLSSILSETYGIPVYQEQIMHISTSVAGYTLAESDTLRKALDVETEIPTPNGWVKLDDIQVGDYVFGSDGMPTEVLEIHDVGVSDNMYDVRFSDGSSIIADGDHLWTATSSLQRRLNKDRISTESAREELLLIRQFKKLRSEGKSWNEIARQFGIKYPETIGRRIKNEQRLEQRLRTETVVSTREMSSTLNYRDQRNWHIKLPQAIQYPKARLPLDPYFVGLWIGDGTSKSSTFTTKDQETVDYIRNLGYSIRHKPYEGAQYGYYVADENGVGITTALQRHGVCSRKFGKNIPDMYMRACVADRWELLKGIVDTDGTVDRKTGRISISSSNKHLAYQYLELARSLGVKAFILESDAILNGRNYGRTWDVGFMCEFYPGKLQRKALAWKAPSITKDKAVVEIIKVAPRRAKCITVAANDHLFVAGRDYILTHNCMGKKSQSEMDKQRTKFIDGAKTANGVDPEEAERLFELLNKFANYGFNRSHAVAYSMLSYQTAWLKVNHPDVFYAALLSVEYGDQDKVAEYIQDARRYGIKVLPPDINKSEREFAITDGVIYFGLSAIKSLGESAIDAILEARGERQFEDLIDITQRIAKGNLNSRALGMLIKAGALDSLGDRSQQLASIESLRKPLPKRNPKPRQLVDDYTPYTSVELLKLERDAIGLYVSGNPLDSYPEFKAARSSTIAGINDWCSTQPAYYQNRVRGIIAGTISGITKIQTKRGQIMAKLLIEDETAVVEMIVFADDWQQMALNATMDSSTLFYCDITPDDDNGSPRLVGKRLLTYDDLVLLPRIAVITLDMMQVDTNTLQALTEDFRGTTDDARGIVRIDTGYDIVSMDLGDLRVSKSIGDALDEIDGVDVVYTYEPKSLLQFVGGR